MSIAYTWKCTWSVLTQNNQQPILKKISKTSTTNLITFIFQNLLTSRFNWNSCWKELVCVDKVYVRILFSTVKIWPALCSFEGRNSYSVSWYETLGKLNISRKPQRIAAHGSITWIVINCRCCQLSRIVQQVTPTMLKTVGVSYLLETFFMWNTWLGLVSQSRMIS